MDSKTLRIKDYWDLINKLNAGVIILDGDHKILRWNDWFQDRTPLDLKNTEDQYFIDVFPELKHARLDHAIEDALQFGFPAVVSNIFNKSPFPLYNPSNLSFDHFTDNRLQQTINVSRIQFSDDKYYCLIQINDVSAAIAREKNLEAQIQERKSIQQSLMFTETRQRTIMETMIDALIIFNDVGTVQSFNPAAEKTFSIDESEIIGKNIALLVEDFGLSNKLKSPVLLKSNLDLMGKTNECIGLKKDGSFFPIDLSISKIDLGIQTLYSAVIRDATDRKQMEKLKQDFITTVSHELRTPLTSIRGSLGLLCGGVISGIPQKAIELISIADKNCQRLIYLINDILDIEKAASGKMLFDVKRMNLKKLVEESIINNNAYAKQYNVDFNFIELTENLFVIVDEQRFQQIMTNLLSNAAKFSNQDTSVDITIQQDKNRIEIDIKDYGQGIPDNFKDIIWQKFTQADTSSTRKIGGTGLGLAITKTLTEAMDGTISFVSKEGEGTTFQVRLPVPK